MIERVASATGERTFSLLEVGAGFGEVPRLAAQQLGTNGNYAGSDRPGSNAYAPAHWKSSRGRGCARASLSGLQLLDLVSCSLFAHHLEPADLALFAAEALRVARCAVLINDLVRHPMHLALVYAGFPLMRSYVSRVDGLASVRRAYVPDEMRRILASAAKPAPPVEISRHFLFRMGVIAWKERNFDC